MSSFLVDNFVDTAGTLLSAHSPNTGGAWSQQNGTTGTLQITASNQLRSTAGGNTIYTNAAAPAGTDYTVAARVDLLSPSAGLDGIIARSDPSTQYSGYHAAIQYVSGANASSILLFAGLSQLGSTITTTLTTGYIDVETTCVGSSVKIAIQRESDSNWMKPDGTWQATKIYCFNVTDSTYSSAGKVGVWLDSSSNDSSGIQVAQLTATDILPPTTIAVSDANIFWSPYGWRANGTTWMQTANTGTYVKFGFSGTSLSVNVDVSTLTGISQPSNEYPKIRYSVDNGAWTTYQLKSTDTSVSVASALVVGNHTFEMHVVNTFTAPGSDRWATPLLIVRITGFNVDNGSATVACAGNIVIRPKRAIFFGDSIGEGVYALSFIDYATSDDATTSFVELVSWALNAEFGNICFGGQGYTITSAYGGAHMLYDASSPTASAWRNYDANTSRLSSGLLTPAPDYIVCNHGTNDFVNGASDAQVEAAIVGFMQAVRVASPLAKIIIVVPFGGFKRTAVTTGFNTANVSNSVLIDLGTPAQIGVDESINPSKESPDGTHLFQLTQAKVGAMLSYAMSAKLNGGGGGSVILL